MISRFTRRNRMLSNFYPCVVELDDMLYPSVEHAYQAAKTDNKKHRRQIQKAERPGIAKIMGRAVELRDDWEEVKIGVMTWLLRDKFHGTFADNQDCGEFLKETSPHVLVEGNQHGDWYWGAVPFQPGIKEIPVWVDDERDWYGYNHLGILLMELRDEILEETTYYWQRLRSWSR